MIVISVNIVQVLGGQLQPAATDQGLLGPRERLQLLPERRQHRQYLLPLHRGQSPGAAAGVDEGPPTTQGKAIGHPQKSREPLGWTRGPSNSQGHHRGGQVGQPTVRGEICRGRC